MLAHPALVAARNRLRHNGIARFLWRRWLAERRYEESFSEALEASIRAGDVVWDVGANVGLYTRRFLDLGAANVICFEPAPDAAATLRATFETNDERGGRVRILPIALSDADGRAFFSAAGAAPTNHLLAAPGLAPAIEVAVRRGDTAQREYRLPAPQVVKIDVEGFELETVVGLGALLASTTLRAIFIEVHFALLHARGLDHAPTQMVRRLAEHGFRSKWVDPSHLRATRT